MSSCASTCTASDAEHDDDHGDDTGLAQDGAMERPVGFSLAAGTKPVQTIKEQKKQTPFEDGGEEGVLATRGGAAAAHKKSKVEELMEKVENVLS